MTHDPDAEAKLLGALISYNSECSEAFIQVKPSDFYVPKHQEIYAALASMYATGRDINTETVIQEQKIKAHAAYIHELAFGVITSWGWEQRVATVKEWHVRRRCEAFGARLLEKAKDMSAEELKAGVQAFDAKLNDMEAERGLVHISEHMQKTAAKFQSIIAGRPAAISTGFKGLDELICGFEPGKFYVIGARPGDGKSAIMLDMAMNCKAKACIFSTEMTATELCERLIASSAYINGRSLKYADQLERRHGDILTAIQRLSAMQIFVDDSPIKTMEQIIGQVRAQKMRGGVDIVFVDYLQFLRCPEDFKDPRKIAQVTHVANMAMSSAKILDLPVVMLASLHRYEGQQQRRPRKEDFRESGQIESNADCAILLYRDPELKQNPTEIMELIVDKCRGGAEGVVKIEFDKPHFRFSEVAF